MGLKPRGVRLTAAQIERFRQTGIRLDRNGRLWHEGAEIEHAGLRRALLGWLDVRESDGRTILRLDSRRYAYIDVEDAHLLAVSLVWRGDRAFVALSDGSEEELDYDSLEVGPGFARYARARRAPLTIRLTTAAYYALARRISETDDGFVLRAAGRRFVIGDRDR